MIEKATDTDMCEYLETHAHVHQTMHFLALPCCYYYLKVLAANFVALPLLQTS